MSSVRPLWPAGSHAGPRGPLASVRSVTRTAGAVSGGRSDLRAGAAGAEISGDSDTGDGSSSVNGAIEL